MDLAKRVTEQHKRIKESIEDANNYFSKNYKRFHEFRRFVFQTSLSSEDISVLQQLQKPILEFNVLNAYVSRLCGEFAKQEPSVAVSAEYDLNFNPAMLEVIEGHMRHILSEARKESAQYDVYKDTLSGGFSAFKVWTEYAHSMSFDQVIRFGRVYEPTLCGWDPLARDPHKGDGQYCFECYPRTKDEFEQEYPDVNTTSLSFNRALDGFSWSYNNGKEDIILLCDYYEKVKKRKRIVRLTNGQIMELDKYRKLVNEWNEMGILEQPPQPIGDPRWTEIETIERYVIYENKVLYHESTDFRYLPIVFVDGDSVVLRQGNDGYFEQFTRPYVYHARDSQKLKNFAGQTLANEIENLIQSKFKIAKEALPSEPEYLHAWTHPQEANTFIYNAFDPNNTEKALPPPAEVGRQPIPNEITSTFGLSDQTIQNVLGSYDAALGINQNQLSGVAIVEAATQSNAAAMPYVVHYMQSLNQVAQIIMDLIPKYYVTPRSIPVVDKEGKRSYRLINQPGGMKMEYTPDALQIKVEAGVNFAIQKNKALQQIISLSQASPLFSQFINSVGLPIIIDNMDIRGVDVLKEKADRWSQQQQAMQQQQMAQQAQQPNPVTLQAQLEQAKLQERAMADQRKAEIDAAKVAIDKQNADTNRMKVAAEIGQEMDKVQMTQMRADAETAKAAMELAIKHAELQKTKLED
jgi:regulator of protease activity HflC (stomatin/prohibitin superfamily)